MPKKVLTIDDSKTLRMIVAKNLNPFGVATIEAENGAIGLERAQSEKPSLILLDCNMPVMDGLKTLEKLKADAALRDIPVVMLTTETGEDSVLKLIKLGISDFIAKPFSRDNLLRKLNPIMGLYEGDIPPEVTAGAGAVTVERDDRKVVVAVDDKENILDQLKQFLQEEYRVLTVTNGTNAAALIRSIHTDWLLLDTELPDMSGVELYKRTRIQLEEYRTKVICMTLRTSESDVLSARQAGIKGVLYKPFSKAEVMAAMAGLAQAEAYLQCLGADQLQFLGGKKVKMLTFPEEGHPSLKRFSSALGLEILKELNEMADEGVGCLILQLTPAVMSDLAIVRKFIALLQHAEKLSLSVRLVAESERIRERLKLFLETSAVRTFNSVDEALESFA